MASPAGNLSRAESDKFPHTTHWPFASGRPHGAQREVGVWSPATASHPHCVAPSSPRPTSTRTTTGATTSSASQQRPTTSAQGPPTTSPRAPQPSVPESRAARTQFLERASNAAHEEGVGSAVKGSATSTAFRWLRWVF